MSFFRLLFVILCFCFATGCNQKQQLRLVTTTTVQDSGFADALKSRFESESNISLLVIARGSGEALELGRRGDADVVLTHSPDQERQFIAEGHGTHREFVMANDFILVGPTSFEKKLNSTPKLEEAFQLISESKFAFISRGDNSGTHSQEKRIWEAVSLKPTGKWYFKSGAGMGATLRIANEKQACTLCDRATWIAMGNNLDLKIILEPKPPVQNEYHLIEVKNMNENKTEVEQFRKFLFSPKTQKWISSFGKENFGEALFNTDSRN